MGGQFRENWKRLTNRLPAGNTSRLNKEEAAAISNIMGKPEFTGGPTKVSDLIRKPKKKPKDKFRITVEDGSGTDPTAAKELDKKKKKKKKKPSKEY